MKGRRGTPISLHEDDLLFILVYVFQLMFVLIGGRNIVTMLGGYALILVCLINAYLCARQWRRHGRYS